MDQDYRSKNPAVDLAAVGPAATKTLRRFEMSPKSLPPAKGGGDLADISFSLIVLAAMGPAATKTLPPEKGGGDLVTSKGAKCSYISFFGTLLPRPAWLPQQKVNLNFGR